LEGLIDFEKEKARLEKELAQLKEDVERLSKKLANQDFISHAPEEEVLKTKERLRESQERSLRLQDNISTLSH
jgi:valyl-tRNA synthetase